MAYNEFLAHKVDENLSVLTIPYLHKKMMGGLIYMVNGHMFIGVDQDRKSGEDRLMVRLGKDQWEEALKLEGCSEMDFTGKSMRGFVFVYSKGIETDEQIQFWLLKALEYNQTKKPK